MIGVWLRDLRECRGVSSSDLAARMGVTRQAVWRWEDGSRGISAGTLAVLLDMLDATDAERLKALDLLKQSSAA